MMSEPSQSRRPANLALVAGGLLIVLCCAVGPAVVGAVAVAGGLIGGWLGAASAVAVAVAVAVGLVLQRRVRNRGRC